MFLMREHPLRGQVEGGCALENESFLGPVKWHRADRRVPFGAQKTRIKILVPRPRMLSIAKMFEYQNSGKNLKVRSEILFKILA
jgi:hypothetical protein